MSDAATIKVTVGCFECTYHCYETTAPKNYDGFGTLTIYSAPEGEGIVRYVLIPAASLPWQTARYSSGLHTPTPVDFVSENDLKDRLLERLFRDPEVTG